MIIGAESTQRIAIVLPDLRSGGAERVDVYLANELVRRGMAVDMVLMQTEGGEFNSEVHHPKR